MLIEIDEEETKIKTDINPDALESVFDEVDDVDDVIVIDSYNDGEDHDDLDIAFKDDEGDW